jgi:hypothetical protein
MVVDVLLSANRHLKRQEALEAFSAGELDFDELDPEGQARISTMLFDTMTHFYKKSFDMSKVDFEPFEEIEKLFVAFNIIFS